jgi:hypothetical protein
VILLQHSKPNQSYDLSWSKHVSTTIRRANKVLGVIKRSIGNNNQVLVVFSSLYKSLLRPILEYAAPVWSPYLIKDIESLEKSKEELTPIFKAKIRRNVL